MMPVRRTQNWLPSIFNDFFDNDWMVKANATAPAINVFETEKEYKVELAAPGMTAFAERSVAMEAPVGLLSGRAVCAADGGTLSRQAPQIFPFRK